MIGYAVMIKVFTFLRVTYNSVKQFSGGDEMSPERKG